MATSLDLSLISVMLNPHIVSLAARSAAPYLGRRPMSSKLLISLGLWKTREVPPPIPVPEPPPQKKSSFSRGWDSERVVTEGDSACSHQLHYVDWDSKRFGPMIADRDPDSGQRIAFTSGNFQSLYRCNCCEREVIRSTWGLI